MRGVRFRAGYNTDLHRFRFARERRESKAVGRVRRMVAEIRIPRVRLLFTSTQGMGHFQPLLPFITACHRAGHDALVVVPPPLEAVVARTGYEYRVGADPPADELAAVWERVPTASMEEARELVLGEIFGRLKTEAMLPAVRAACEEWRPDLLVREAGEYAGAVAADEFGVGAARVGISLAAGEAGMLEATVPVLTRLRRGIGERIWASPYLTLFPGSLDPSPFPSTHRFSDPVDETAAELPDWWDGGDGPLVYATFGSVTGEMTIAGPACRAVMEAVRPLPVRVLFTVGRAMALDALPEVPHNVHVERWVPQAAVLGDAAAVVCHGGSGTTVGTLAAGVPLVIVPLFADQPENARQVALAGAGIAVEAEGAARDIPIRVLTDEDVPRIRAAIDAILGEAAYGEAAARISTEMRALPRVDAAWNTVAETAG